MPNYHLSGFKAVRPQLAANILHSHMRTVVILLVEKGNPITIKSLPKLLFMPPHVVGAVQHLHFQVFIYVLCLFFQNDHSSS